MPCSIVANFVTHPLCSKNCQDSCPVRAEILTIFCSYFERNDDFINSFWKSRSKKCQFHWNYTWASINFFFSSCSVFSFRCSFIVFSSSSDSSSSYDSSAEVSLDIFGFSANLALFLLLDVVAWGSSEMQNSTIVRSITNQKIISNCFYLLINQLSQAVRNYS